MKCIHSTVIALFLSSTVFSSAEELKTDLLIVGATESGWAAAIQAARMGVESITIVHDGKWFGGQFTEQALACVDENKGVGKVGWGVDWHPMKRSFHRSGLFKELMDRIEAFNTAKYGSPMPGKPFHGPSTFRPAEAEAVFRKMIRPYIESGQVRMIWNHYPVRADVEELALKSISFAPVGSKQEDLVVQAGITIDASDWGEVIQVSGAAYECGPDPKSRYNEPSAPVDLSKNPSNEMNPITWAMIVAESSEETPIPKPDRFDDRNYPRATPFSQKAFSKQKWDNPNPGIGSILHWPAAGEASKRQLSVYSVRRIVDGYESKEGKTSILLCYMNGMDYPLERLPQPVTDALEATEPGASKKNIVEMTRAQREIIFADARRHSLGMLYHLQNFVHDRAPDKTNSFRKFHLSNEFGTAGSLPPKPYIREGLRLKAMYMMREQDGRNRDSETKTGAKERFAHVMYPDGLFAWQFHYDFHRTGRTYLKSERENGPWIDFHKPNRHTKFMSDRSVFPMRSLIPVRMNGLLGAQGNVGFSSIVSAAIRLHDQRIHIGQAAGATAAVALIEKVNPRAIVYDSQLLESVRDSLCSDELGGEPLLLWPFRDLSSDDSSFVAANRLAALGMLPRGEREVDFRPDDPADGSASTTRGEAAALVWENRRKSGIAPPQRPALRTGDADDDGIIDSEDALLFTPNKAITFKIEPLKTTPSSDGIPEKPTPTYGFMNFGSRAGNCDHGLPFDPDRGFGWKRDLGKNIRIRKILDGPRDSFVFTRQHDHWKIAVQNGRYHITLCIGDSSHDQPKQSVSVEGTLVFDKVSTIQGHFAEKTVEVEVKDGYLSLEIGTKEANSNTCLNWLQLDLLD